MKVDPPATAGGTDLVQSWAQKRPSRRPKQERREGLESWSSELCLVRRELRSARSVVICVPHNRVVVARIDSACQGRDVLRDQATSDARYGATCHVDAGDIARNSRVYQVDLSVARAFRG
jgi:hypothetical protein